MNRKTLETVKTDPATLDYPKWKDIAPDLITIARIGYPQAQKQAIAALLDMAKDADKYIDQERRKDSKK